jgi:hypothetical protein
MGTLGMPAYAIFAQLAFGAHCVRWLRMVFEVFESVAELTIVGAFSQVKGC